MTLNTINVVFPTVKLISCIPRYAVNSEADPTPRNRRKASSYQGNRWTSSSSWVPCICYLRSSTRTLIKPRRSSIYSMSISYHSVAGCSIVSMDLLDTQIPNENEVDYADDSSEWPSNSGVVGSTTQVPTGLLSTLLQLEGIDFVREVPPLLQGIWYLSRPPPQVQDYQHLPNLGEVVRPEQWQERSPRDRSTYVHWIVCLDSVGNSS